MGGGQDRVFPDWQNTMISNDFFKKIRPLRFLNLTFGR